MKGFGFRFFPLILALSLAGCAADAPVTRTANPRAELAGRIRHSHGLRVLFIGNSYCFGAPMVFKRLALSRGRKVEVDQQSFGGWTLARHARHPGTLAKIRDGRWDIVVIQEQSVIPSLPENARTAAMSKPLRNLTNEVRTAGAIPVLYQSWGRRDGDPKMPGDSFTAMNHRIRDGYHAAAKDAGGMVVVPVGDRWENEVAAGRSKALFNPDGSHPTKAGNRLTAEVFYQSFFGG